MANTFHELLLLITYSGIGISLFLILLLRKRWAEQKAARLLTGILLCLLIIFLAYCLVNRSATMFIHTILAISIVLPFALGPLFLFYIKSIYKPDQSLKPLFLKALIPFYLALLSFSIPFTFLIADQTDLLLNYTPLLFIPLIGIILFAYYIYRCFKLLNRFNTLVKHNFSNLTHIDLLWLNRWLKGLGLFLVLDISSGLLSSLHPLLTYTIFINVVYLLGLIVYMGYFGLHQTHVFHSTPPALLTEAPKVENKTKKINLLLKETGEIEALKIKLDTLFTTEHIHEDESLNLKKVAELMLISEKKLSELINIHLDSNFYEYVNMHRISAFQTRVKNGDAERHTLLAIAFDSGFNSKASFNRIFKQKTGLTPSQYKKQHQHG